MADGRWGIADGSWLMSEGGWGIVFRDSAILNIPVIEPQRAVIPTMLLSGNPEFCWMPDETIRT